MTWTDQLVDGAWPADVVEWRRTHTWGGFEWFPEAEFDLRWMRGEEDLDEVEWLLDGGVHPLLIAQTVGRAAAAIYRTAKRHGRERVSDAFGPYSTLKTKAASAAINGRKAS